MVTVQQIINTIDLSKMEREYVSIDMCESEFHIYEYIEQPRDNVRLTYCFYHSWTCTDTEVGIRVWYFDDEPVCISWQPYRKSDEIFSWISKEHFNNVRNYTLSLKEGKLDIDIINDETIDNVINKFNSIEYKEFEVRNINL